MSGLPALFLGHGAPDLLLSEHPARTFLGRLPHLLPGPRAIVIISAHWEAARTLIGTAPAPETIHDFSGWPAALYDVSYPARTEPVVIARIENCLDAAGIDFRRDHRRGYDHGVWVPLSISYGSAAIPVVQISLTRSGSARFHFQLGQALAPLRQEGILIVGSGATVHNLRHLAPEGTAPRPWAPEFETWLLAAVRERDLKRLLAFPAAPDTALLAHPSPEHLLPFFVSLGAGWDSDHHAVLHQSFSYGSIGMTCFSFGRTQGPQDTARQG
jgi:4,5-DOPA dioxygenase extradiol